MAHRHCRRAFSRQLWVRFLLLLTASAALCTLIALDIFKVQAYQGGLVRDIEREEYEEEGDNIVEDIANQTWAPFHNVSPQNPKMVVLLSYQRCGSTMLSQLFNANPAAFYQFEPLDALYAARYGTAYGWNVPTDITTYKNGSERVPPRGETDAVAAHLSSLLSCDFSRLPTEALVHPYQLSFPAQFLRSAQYVHCLQGHKFDPRRVCAEPEIRAYCGQRFGERSSSRLEDCRLLILHNHTAPSGAGESLSSAPRGLSAPPPPGVLAAFRRRRECLVRLRSNVVEPCLHHLRDACEGSTLRAVKVVRATMASMGALLRSHSNLRVIHLLRDPRGVTRSRHAMHRSVTGMHAREPGLRDGNETMVREAAAYCRGAAKDVRGRGRLGRAHPGRVMEVVYDAMVEDPQRYAQDIYRFLALPPLKKGDPAYDALSVVAGVGVTPTGPAQASSGVDIANQWRASLTNDVRARVWEVCREFFEIVKYDWKL